MQVSADGLRDVEEEAGSAKRQKIAALDCSSTDDDDEITISVRAALTGEMLQPVRVNSTILGGELVDLLARQHRQDQVKTRILSPGKVVLERELVDLLAREQRQDRVGTCRLLHGEMQIQRSRSLRGQGITDGSEISFVWISISAEQQRVVVRKMHAGNFISEDDMEAEDMDALNSLVALYWNNSNLDYLFLPSGLQNLTFGDRFNQSLDKTALPSGLQSLTFGWAFNQSLGNTTLPNGLQSLEFGYPFNQSLDNTALPSCLQSRA